MLLTFAENINGEFKKATFEAISYGKTLAEKLGTSCAIVALGTADAGNLANLGKYGADKVIHISNTTFDKFDAKAHSKAIAEVAEKIGAKTIILSNTYTGKSIGPRLAIRLKGSLAPDAISLPNLENGFSIKRTVFSNKGFADVDLTAETKIIALSPNSYQVNETDNQAAVENFETSVSDSDFGTKSISQNVKTGKIPLTEAELVVSAGRGLKGPENWGMIEELATTLGAATACSKPVSDMDWRPHDEHVGQTGITIKPNLYIACGISGAIQHLAGVSSSKVIVAINTDPEAPFFKVADYGVVGDAFEVVPALNEAIKAHLASR